MQFTISQELHTGAISRRNLLGHSLSQRLGGTLGHGNERRLWKEEVFGVWRDSSVVKSTGFPRGPGFSS